MGGGGNRIRPTGQSPEPDESRHKFGMNCENTTGQPDCSADSILAGNSQIACLKEQRLLLARQRKVEPALFEELIV